MTDLKLNMFILLQLAGLALVVQATPLAFLLGVALIVFGGFLYRRRSRIRRAKAPAQPSSTPIA